jgi:diguanylate cyclase (GGDEF)-like protein/PAS domain S-box-containing protein
MYFVLEEKNNFETVFLYNQCRPGSEYTDREQNMSHSAETNKPVILIIDDTPVNLGVVIDSLENRGYRLLVAQGGTEGLQRAAFTKPDLILLDVMMPELDGFEVCRRLKSNEATADIPVIFMTALGDSEHKITGFKAGGVDYLAKPMQIDEVLARVGTHLNLRIMQRQLQQQNEQLQRQQQELEQKVEQRTAELSASNRFLRDEIDERKRVENTMKFIAQRGWMEGGEDFLSALARYLGQLLEVDYVIIDKLADNPAYAETVAIYANGGILPNMQYPLAHTPCANVVEGTGTLCRYPSGVQQLFPEDHLLVDMQVESYIGLPLSDSTGETIGLIAVMDGKPVLDEVAVTSVLQLVATAAAAELKRRQSEQALNESRQFLSRVIDTIADPIYVKDREHRWILLNQAFCEFIGQPPENLLGKSDADFFPEHQAGAQWANDELVFTTRQETALEEDIVTNQGELRNIHIRKTLFTDPNGNPNLVGVISDITERKQYERNLLKRAQLEEQLSCLAASAPGFMFTIRIDADGHASFPFASAGIEQLVGLRPEDLRDSADRLHERYHPDDLPRLLALTEESRRTLALFRIEIRVFHPDNGMRWAEIRSTPQRHPDGSTEWHGLMIDITERKQMEEKVLQREQEFRGLLENSPDPTMRYDKNCRRVYVNPAMERLTGKSAAQLLNSQPSDSQIIGSDDAENLMRIIRHVLATGQPAESELSGNTYSDQTSYFHIRYAPEFGGQGDVTGVIAIGRDITARKQVENLRYQRERELRTLVDNLPTVVVRYDREFRRVYANPAYLQLTGRAESDIIGHSLQTSWRAANISADQYASILAEVMQSGVKADVLLEWTDAGGRLISHAMKIVPEYTADGKIDSVLALGFDLSDRRHQQIIERNRQRVFEKMAHGDNLHSILDQVALYVESAKPGRLCAIMLLDELQEQLQIAAAPSFPKSFKTSLNPQLSGVDGDHCRGWIKSALSGQRSIIKDITQSQCRCLSLCHDFIRDSGAQACWSEPIFSSTNHVLGVATLYINHAGEPDESDLALLLQAGHLSSIAIERKRIEQQMYRQASYDQLTGLPNRRLFGNRLREEIAKAERKNSSLAVLFVDLDRFKEINDTMGHEAGDDLLVEAAQRIRSCVRESDTVARLGGDEFVVILPKVDEIMPQDRVAQSIVDTMARPFRLGDQYAYVTASIGIAGYPQDAGNAEVLIGCADQAMYAAKDMGRNCFSFFNQGMLEQARQRLELVNELRGALGSGQLEVYYQPIIEIASGRAVKAEALLRWQHPELGMVSPARFIPIAEETDLIQEIGAWVLCEAANIAKRWHGLNEHDRIPQISINMSPRQFTKDSGVQTIIDHLQDIGLDPRYLVVEITEGLLLDDCSAVTDKLELLRSAGIQLSLDDFGTGYSAMAYLKKFNIDYLKIDRSFVRDLETDPGDRAIAEAIVVMAHRLGLKVIAEGVETEGQLELLAGVGCEYVQGYLYAKPMPAETFLEYVTGR